MAKKSITNGNSDVIKAKHYKKWLIISIFVVLQIYGILYWLLLEGISWPPFIFPILFAILSFFSYWYFSKRNNWPLIKHLEIPYDTSLITFFLSLIITFYLAGITMLNVNNWLEKDFGKDGKISSLDVVSVGESWATITGHFTFRDNTNKERPWNFSGKLELDGEKVILVGTVPLDLGKYLGLLFDEYILGIRKQLALANEGFQEIKLDDLKAKLKELEPLNVYAEYNSIKDRKYFGWLFLEALCFSLFLTAGLRIWLIARYKNEGMSIPSALAHKEPDPIYVEISSPSGEKHIAETMLKILKPLNEYDPASVMHYPTDFFALEILDTEKNIPVSFINVWCIQSELCKRATTSSEPSNFWNTQDCLSWRRDMFKALNKAWNTANNNRINGKLESSLNPFHYEDEPEMQEKLKGPFGARILLVGVRAIKSLALQAIVNFHNIAEITLFVMKLEQIENLNFKHFVEKETKEFNEFKTNIDKDFNTLFERVSLLRSTLQSPIWVDCPIEKQELWRESQQKTLEKSIYDQEAQFIAIGPVAWYGFKEARLDLPSAARIIFFILLHQKGIYFGNDYLKN